MLYGNVHKIWAFLKRDFLIESSYQLNFFLTTLNSFVILFLFYFIGKIVRIEDLGIARYGSDYFSFVLIGYGFFQYFQLASNAYSQTIVREQLTGCLEAMLCSQTSPQITILMSSLYSIIFSLVHLAVIFVAGTTLFHGSFAQCHIGAALTIFILSLLLFVSFSIVSASFIIVMKKGDPFGWFVTSVNFLLGGAFFPVSVMPAWLQSVARFIPITYSLDGLRLAMLQGHGFLQLASHIRLLGLLDIVVFPLSLWIFTKAVAKAKRDGTLMYY